MLKYKVHHARLKFQPIPAESDRIPLLTLLVPLGSTKLDWSQVESCWPKSDHIQKDAVTV